MCLVSTLSLRRARGYLRSIGYQPPSSCGGEMQGDRLAKSVARAGVVEANLEAHTDVVGVGQWCPFRRRLRLLCSAGLQVEDPRGSLHRNVKKA